MDSDTMPLEDVKAGKANLALNHYDSEEHKLCQNDSDCGQLRNSCEAYNESDIVEIVVNNNTMIHNSAIDSNLNRANSNCSHWCSSLSTAQHRATVCRKHSPSVPPTRIIVSGRLTPLAFNSSIFTSLKFTTKAFYRFQICPTVGHCPSNGPVMVMGHHCQTLSGLIQPWLDVNSHLLSRTTAGRKSTRRRGRAGGERMDATVNNSQRTADSCSSMLQHNLHSAQSKCSKLFASSAGTHLLTALALLSILLPIRIAADSSGDIARNANITSTTTSTTTATTTTAAAAASSPVPNLGTILTKLRMFEPCLKSNSSPSSSPTQSDWESNVNASLLFMSDCPNPIALTSSPAPASQETTPDQAYVAFLDRTRFWVQRVLVPTITVIGVVGNTITIVIMTRRRMRSSTNWYLAALAITDMIYLVFTFILSLKHYPNAHHSDYFLYWYCIPFLLMITDAASNSSVWLTVTFTIERYIAVCHPIRGKVICTESRAKKVIFCVFLVCVTVTLPTPFEWVVVEKQDPVTNATFFAVDQSKLGKNDTYRNVYYQFSVLLFVVVPFVLLVIFNNFLIRSVHLSNKQRAQMVMAKDNYQQGRYRTESVASASTATTGSAALNTANNSITANNEPNSGTPTSAQQSHHHNHHHHHHQHQHPHQHPHQHQHQTSVKYKASPSLIKSQSNHSSSTTPPNAPTTPTSAGTPTNPTAAAVGTGLPNAATAVAIHHQSPSATSRQEIRITIMLIAVVILFLVCQTPTAIWMIYTTFHVPKDNSREQLVLTALSNIFNFLMSIYAAGNFVLYCLLSQKYRRTFINMFCRCFAPSRRYTTPSVCTRLNAMESVAGAGYTTVYGHTNATSAGRYLQVPNSLKQRSSQQPQPQPQANHRQGSAKQRSSVAFSMFAGSIPNESNTCFTSRSTRLTENSECSNNNNNNNNNNNSAPNNVHNARLGNGNTTNNNSAFANSNIAKASSTAISSELNSITLSATPTFVSVTPSIPTKEPTDSALACGRGQTNLDPTTAVLPLGDTAEQQYCHVPEYGTNPHHPVTKGSTSGSIESLPVGLLKEEHCSPFGVDEREGETVEQLLEHLLTDERPDDGRPGDHSGWQTTHRLKSIVCDDDDEQDENGNCVRN